MSNLFIPFDISGIDKSYNNYKNLLDSLPKHSVYICWRSRTSEYYGVYDWVTKRNKLHEIAKTEKNDETKLRIVFKMNQPDDGIHNILQFL